MRRWLLPALMIPLLLTGCGKSVPERKLEELRKTLAAAEEIALTAEITAELGEEVFACTLGCTAAGERVVVEVTAPESVAGVRAVLTPDGATLEYETLSLGVGQDSPLSPIGALPRLLSALRGASVLRSWTEWAEEKTLFVREYWLSEDMTLRVWFDAATLLPAHAEFIAGGRAALRCDILSFTWKPPQKG